MGNRLLLLISAVLVGAANGCRKRRVRASRSGMLRTQSREIVETAVEKINRIDAD